MNKSKVIGWAIVVFAGWYLVTDPHGAAHAAAALLNALKGLGNSLSVFFTSL